MAHISAAELSTFLTLFFASLSKKGIQYCVLRQYHDLPERLVGSDIDIVVNPASIDAARQVLGSTARDSGLSLLRETPYGSVRFFHFYKKHDLKYEFLRIDLNCDVRYFGACFLHAADILAKAVQYKHFWVAHPVHEAILELIPPLIASGKIKEKHRDRVIAVAGLYAEEFQRELGRLLGDQLARRVVGCIGKNAIQEVEQFRGTLRRRILTTSLRQDPLDCLVHFVRFVHDLIRLRVHPPGCVVVVWHPDEGLRSQVSAALSVASSTIFLGDHKLFEKKTLILPSEQRLAGAAGFLYYTMDCFFAYILFIRHAIRRHGIVILNTGLNRFTGTKKDNLFNALFRRFVFLDLSNRSLRSDVAVTKNGHLDGTARLVSLCIDKIIGKVSGG